MFYIHLLLKQISIPSSVILIEDNAFNGHFALNLKLNEKCKLKKKNRNNNSTNLSLLNMFLFLN